MTDRAIDRELRGFRASTWYKRRRTRKAKTQAGQDFTSGMVARLSRRLLELFGSNRDQALLDEAAGERDARFPDSSHVPDRARSARYLEAAFAGAHAGDGVGLAHGVGQDDAPALIGGAP